MAAWLLIAPAETLSRHSRERYLERIDDRGDLHLTPHAIRGKRFASAGIARRWANQFGERFEDFTVGRR